MPSGLPPLIVPLSIVMSHGNDNFGSRWFVTEDTVRPYLIIALSPFLNKHLRLSQCGEDLPISILALILCLDRFLGAGHDASC